MSGALAVRTVEACATSIAEQPARAIPPSRAGLDARGLQSRLDEAALRGFFGKRARPRRRVRVPAPACAILGYGAGLVTALLLIGL